MDPVTHLLASYTLGRAARARISSPQMAVFLLGGTALDIDWLWHLPEPLSPLRAYGTVTHSIAGAAVVAAAIGTGVWTVARRRQPAPSLARLLGAAFLSAGLHLLLDLCTATGIELYWPARAARVSWNLLSSFDAILITILAVCALLAVLFGLVTEEIGAQKAPRPTRGWPAAALALAMLYIGARIVLHERAEMLLANAEYKGKAALHSAAFASGSSPFSWRGVVETDAFLAEVEVPVGTGRPFVPKAAVVQYKPEPAPQLDAAAAAPLARAYTSLARFPALSLETTAEGTRADLRELGDSPFRDHRGAWHAVIILDGQSHLVHQELRYEAARVP